MELCKAAPKSFYWIAHWPVMPNATALTVLFVGACAVSAAIFLVLELSKPLEGFIKLSNAPLRNALQHLDQ